MSPTIHPIVSKPSHFSFTCILIDVAPDRPAPLSVKSRGSQIRHCTPTATSILRSVSTPICTQTRSNSEQVPQRDLKGKTHATKPSHLFPFATAESSSRSTGDVFSAAHTTEQLNRNPFTEKLQNSEDRQYGTTGRYVYRDSGGEVLGPYQLDASDVASESSYGTFTSPENIGKNQARTDAPCYGGIIRDESFDALESYIGSEDEEQGSVLDSVPDIIEENMATEYQSTSQVPSSQPSMAGPVPRESQRHAAAEAHRKTQAPNLTAQAFKFHHPLPLRSYESEAIKLSNAGVQACSGHNRSKSVSSVIASRRSTTEPIAAPHVPDFAKVRNSPEDIEQGFYERSNPYAKISEQVDTQAASRSQHSSSASTLAAFPIPPMDNPVGQLPMLISRAISSPQSLHTAISQQSAVSASVDDTYRAIVKVAMDAVLHRTRKQGKGLSIIDWDGLTSFERAWREMNAVLLIAIYGRKDVVLTEADIDYIDRVAEVLRNESGNVDSKDWVRRMFEVDV